MEPQNFCYSRDVCQSSELGNEPAARSIGKSAVDSSITRTRAGLSGYIFLWVVINDVLIADNAEQYRSY